MSNPTVSFRISDYHLARGLRAIRTIEPNWKLTTPAELIRTIFYDYIAKSEHHNNTPLNIDPELLEEIALSRTGSTKQIDTLSQQLAPLPQIRKAPTFTERELEEIRIFEELKRASQQVKQTQQEQNIDNQIASTWQTKQPAKPSTFDDLNKTESELSSVTDFSPPKDWKE